MGWKHQLATSVFSRDFVRGCKRELQLVWFRVQCFFPSNLWKISKLKKQNRLKLNIGAGPHTLEGWLNIDLQPNAGIQWDVRWGLPFGDSSVTHIHCEHFLEHLDYPHDSLKFLSECRRVLTPAGEFRLIVPDAAKYIQAYVKKDSSYWEALKDLGNSSVPFATEMEIMNQAFRMGGDHLFAYDRNTLRHILVQAGFSYFQESDHMPANFQDQSDPWRLVESLYLTVRA